MRKILILSFSDLNRDPRVSRQVFALKDKYSVVTAGLCQSTTFGCPHIQLFAEVSTSWGRVRNAFLLGLRRYDQFYWSLPKVQYAFENIAANDFDLILANDINTLPLALELSSEQGKVFLDAHEYEPARRVGSIRERYLAGLFWDFLCEKYLPQVDAMVSVGDVIAKRYSDNYGVDCGVIYNAPEYEELLPTRIDSKNIRLIHHGGLHRARKLEKLIELMRILPDCFSLDLIFIQNDADYYRELVEAASDLDNVRFIPPVNVCDIARTINAYDLGLCLIWPSHFNYEMCLPNKFFEFIQARLGIVTWPSPEMACFTSTEGLGVVANEYSVQSIAAELMKLDVEDIAAFKQRSHEVAKKYNAEVSMDKYRAVVDQLMVD